MDLPLHTPIFQNHLGPPLWLLNWQQQWVSFLRLHYTEVVSSDGWWTEKMHYVNIKFNNHPYFEILNSNDQIIKHLYHINGNKMLCKFAWSILSLSSLRQIWLPCLSHGLICLKDCRLWSIPAKSQNLTMKSCPPVTSRAPEGSNANADT